MPGRTAPPCACWPAGQPAITTFLPGVWPRRVRPEHCAPLGAALARLHLAGAGYAGERRNALGPAVWPPLLERCRPAADEVQPGLARGSCEPPWTASCTHWPACLPRGHIHADLFPDNVFFLDGEVSGLIDFYFACTDLLAYDVAICLNAWCFETDFSFNVTRGRALLRGYNAVRPCRRPSRRPCPSCARVPRCASC